MVYRNFAISWVMSTQLQPTHAREVFPCFDEPRFKAKFQLTVDRPVNYQPTLSNTPIIATKDVEIDG